MVSVYRGKNLYRHHLSIGRRIADRIARLEGVVGVLGTGSIGRRFADWYSDLDLIVYAHKESLIPLRHLLSHSFISFRGIQRDIEVQDFERAVRKAVPSSYWTQLERWNHTYARILRDPEQKLQALLDSKLVFPEQERRQLLSFHGNMAQEHVVYYPAMWLERGEFYNAAHTLHRAVESILLWVYADRRLFQPYMPKWPFFHFETGELQMPDVYAKLTAIYRRPPRTATQLHAVRRGLLAACEQIGLCWDCYSEAEAIARSEARWRELSAETKGTLK